MTSSRAVQLCKNDKGATPGATVLADETLLLTSFARFPIPAAIGTAEAMP